MITREQFIQFLSGPRLAFVTASIREGLNDYSNPENYSALALLDHNARTRANIRNSHIVAQATRLAVEIVGVQVRMRNVRGRILFVLDDQYQISFKKLDERLRSSNVWTRQAQDFLEQKTLWPHNGLLRQAQESLAQKAFWPNDEAPVSVTNLIAGFRLDASEIISELWITCPAGDMNAWEVQLTGADIIELFPAGTADGPETATMEPIHERVRLKPGAVRRNGTDESTDARTEAS